MSCRRSPSRSMRPSSGASNPASPLRSVLLPAPFGPTPGGERPGGEGAAQMVHRRPTVVAEGEVVEADEGAHGSHPSAQPTAIQSGSASARAQASRAETPQPRGVARGRDRVVLAGGAMLCCSLKWSKKCYNITFTITRSRERCQTTRGERKSGLAGRRSLNTLDPGWGQVLTLDIALVDAACQVPRLDAP